MHQPPPLPPVNPYAAPTARIDDFHSDQLELADRLLRLVAKIIDGLIIGAVVAVVGIVAAIALPAMQKSDGSGNETAMVLVFLLGGGALLAILIVNMVLLHRHGQTIGKRMFNMRIVRADGSRCSLPRIIFALATGHRARHDPAAWLYRLAGRSADDLPRRSALHA